MGATALAVPLSRSDRCPEASKAPYLSVWRINAGISQGDTSVTTEVNLSLALQDNPDVKSSELTEVWAQGHTTAERTGTSTGNFLAWVGKTSG